MGKVKITWDEDMKKEIHKACKEYFSTVPIERLEKYFSIVLYDTYDTTPNVKEDDVNLIKDIQYDIKGKNNIM